MLIQPFLENALAHGLLHKNGLKKLWLRFQLQKDCLRCEIEDNGVGRSRAKEIKTRQKSSHESFSVKAIKRRFELLGQQFKGELGLEYQDLMQNGQPSGTLVLLRIPIKKIF